MDTDEPTMGGLETEKGAKEKEIDIKPTKYSDGYPLI